MEAFHDPPYREVVKINRVYKISDVYSKISSYNSLEELREQLNIKKSIVASQILKSGEDNAFDKIEDLTEDTVYKKQAKLYDEIELL